MPEENLTCCMCLKSDREVAILGTGTPVHPQCMEDAALGALVKEFGYLTKTPPMPPKATTT